MKQNKDISFIEKIFIVLILLSSGTTIVSDYGIIRYILFLVYIIMVFHKKIKITNANFQVTFLVGFFGLWFFQLLWHGNINNLLYFLKIYTILVMMVTYANAENKKNILRIDYFMKILFFFSIASNIVYFLLIIGYRLPQFTSSLGLPCYFYLLQEFYDPTFGIMNYRNNGIFWEPGVNHVFMNFLLIYTLFDERRFRKAADRRRTYFKCVYIVITIVTTGSVLGYILCAAIIILKGLSGIKKQKIALMSLLTLSLVTVAIPFVIFEFNVKQKTVSYEYRIGDLKIGLTQFLQHPVIGKGIGDDSFQYEFANAYGLARSNSNGIMKLILSTGILGTTFYALSAYKFTVWINNCFFKKSKIAFLVWIILSLMNEPLETCAIMIFLLGIGWHSKPIMIEKREENSQM